METLSKSRQLRRIVPIVPLGKASSETKLAIPLKSRIEVIDIDQILYLKSDSNYTEIYLDSGKKIVSSVTLKRYASKLNTNQFIRIHQSYLINKSSISCYLTNRNIIVLHNSQEIPVSSSKKEGLLRYLKSLMV